MNKKIKIAKCIEDYSETMIDGNQNNFDKVHLIDVQLFQKDHNYYYKAEKDNDEITIYVADQAVFLRDLNRWHTEITELDLNTFVKHFEIDDEEFKKINNTKDNLNLNSNMILSSTLNQYLEEYEMLSEKIKNKDLFNDIEKSEYERISFLNKILFGSII